MKFFVLLFLSLATCGHIYVSDIQLDFQNTGYFCSAQLYFKLETNLYTDEVLRIVWPFSFNSTTSTTITAFITYPGSTTNITATTAVIDSSNSQAYAIKIQNNLEASQWYRLNLSTITLTGAYYQSPTVKYYKQPIQMSTHSGQSSGSITNYQLYDYNNVCGFVAIAPEPTTLNSVVIGVSENSTSLPSTKTANTLFEVSYTIYVTVKTSNDYEYGGTYYFAMDGDFIWTGSCETISQECSEEDFNCTAIYPLVQGKDFICTHTNSLLTLTRFQNSSGLAINNKEYLKFKIQVKNPNKVKTGGLSVRLVSNYARYIYEVMTLSSLFATKIMGITAGPTSYFWGLSYSTSTACPIRIYLSQSFAVWNKISLSFAPESSFPSTTYGYKMQTDIQAVTYINDISIYTDCEAMTGYSIQCASDATYKKINCLYIGKLQKNITKHLKFSFVSSCADYSQTKFSSFGQTTFYHLDDASAITSASSPTDASMDTKICNADFYTENSVFDSSITTPYSLSEYKMVNQDSSTIPNLAHRSSIKYSKSEIDILIQINTDLNQQCCQNVATLYYDCYSSLSSSSYQNSACNSSDLTADEAAYNIVLKIITNRYALSFNTSNLESSTNTSIYKGVEILYEMFGKHNMTTNPLVQPTDNTFICKYQYETSSGDSANATICSSYSNPISYTDASSNDTTKQYRFNQWFLRDSYWELHLTCYSGAAKNQKICGHYANAEEADKPKGVVIKQVTLNITANPLFPSQTDLDFILCYRYTSTAANLVLSGSTTLASSSLMNAQIIHERTKISYSSTNATYFRIGLLNFYNTSGADDMYSYVPTLLRIGGYIHQDDLSTNKGIALFFDQGFYIQATTLSSKMPLNPTECASPIQTGFTCSFAAQQKIGSTAIANLHSDYYPSLNTIAALGSTITAATEFNYYFPVKITGDQLSYAFIALISNYNLTVTASSVFKLFGSAEQISSNTYQNFNLGVNTFPSPTASTPWTHVDTDAIDVLSKSADWEVASGTAFGYGTVNTAGSFTKTTTNAMAFKSTTNIYPDSNVTNAVIDASAGTWNDPFNDDQSSLSQNFLQFRASTHFIVHSFIKFWSGDMNWTLSSSSSTGPFSGKCTSMAITSYYASGTNPTSYLIICPYEGSFSSSATSTAGTFQLTIGTWKWPDYYGLNAPIGAHLRYLWSDKQGFLKAYLAEAKQGSALGECTLAEATSIFALNTTQQKAQIGITLLSSLSLKKRTYSSKDKEKMIIQLTVNQSTINSLTTSQCSCGLAKIKCSVTKSDNQNLQFTLSNLDQSNEQTIPKALLTLTFWLSSSQTSEENLNYTANIYSYFYLNYPLQTGATTKITINTCASSASWTSTSKQSREISVSDITTGCKIRNARTSFAFTFSVNYAVLDLSKFVIDLSFLATTNKKQETNLRCGFYQSGVISHAFEEIKYSQLDQISAQYRQIESILLKPTEFESVSYTFKCYGGKNPIQNPDSTELITVSNKISTSIIAAGQSSSQESIFNSFITLSSNNTIANITLSRSFDSIGQDATYSFNVKLGAKVDSETNKTSMRFLAGSQLFVEFARDISPRFNKLGVIRCYHETDPTYCIYDGERRISFLARTDLNHNITYGHNFSIVGVSVPQTFNNYAQIYFALVPYLSSFNAMEFQDSETITDSSPSDMQVTSLPVVNYFQGSDNQIRSSYNFQMHIKFPASMINQEIPLWVDFPEEFDEAFFLYWSPVCRLENIKINANDTIENFVNYCEMNSIRRIQITLLTDSNQTTEKLFNLSISSIPTYNYEQPFINMPLVWMGKSSTPTIPYYKTNLGYFNGTMNLRKFTYTDSSSKQLLNWSESNLVCYPGTYSCSAKLTIENFDYFKNDIANITASGIYQPYFSFHPSTISATTGKLLEFQIAPKAQMLPGVYQLTWSHNAPDYYSTIPPLNLILLSDKATISYEYTSTSFKIQNGGKSLPIIFCFEGKMPESDVTITGTAWSQSYNTKEDTNETITSPDITFVQASQNLTFKEAYTQDSIYFVLKGQKSGTNDSESTIQWVLSGTNADSYTSLPNMTVTIIDAVSVTPVLTILTPVSSAGKMQLTASCSQAGNLYYILSQNQTQTQIEFTKIQDLTEDLLIEQTELGLFQDNPARTIYGFSPASTAGLSQILSFDEILEAQATYYMRVYCVNQLNISSVAHDTTWEQESNNGKPLIISMQFELNISNSSNATSFASITLNEFQQKEIACLISHYTANEKERVLGKYGVSCNSTLSNNSTQRILSTTEFKNRLLDDTEFNNTEYFIIYPNLFRENGDLSTTKTLIESTEFKTTLELETYLKNYRITSPISCSINTDSPSIPSLSTPIVYPSQNSITFIWNQSQNTNGFIFVGITAGNSTSKPTTLQLKMNSGFSFNGHAQTFYFKTSDISLIIESLEVCTDYKYFWIATNEEYETYQYQTDLKEGNITTIGCAIFAEKIKMLAIVIIYLGLLFIN